VGSGGNFALAAARALITSGDLSARQVVQRGLEIAAEICVYTNPNITIVEPT
jgi:ATP-dependent HslUV protease subunit HslV